LYYILNIEIKLTPSKHEMSCETLLYWQVYESEQVSLSGVTGWLMSLTGFLWKKCKNTLNLTSTQMAPYLSRRQR